MVIQNLNNRRTGNVQFIIVTILEFIPTVNRVSWGNYSFILLKGFFVSNSYL